MKKQVSKKWPAYVLMLFAVLHLGFHVVHNSYALFKQSLAALGDVLRWPTVRWYAHFTGGETSYGFFAPQIASQFYLQTDFLDKAGRLMEHRDSPGLQSYEGSIRYAKFLTKLQKLLPCAVAKTKACPDQRWIRAVIANMAQRHGQAIQADQATNRVYVLRHVPLGIPVTHRLPELTLIYTHTIPIKLPKL